MLRNSCSIMCGTSGRFLARMAALRCSSECWKYPSIGPDGYCGRGSVGNGQSTINASATRLVPGPVDQIVDRLHVVELLEGREERDPVKEVGDVFEGNDATAIVPHLHDYVMQLVERVTP